jgi:hypothetical protein
MTRDRAAVKKIVLGAIKNNARVIVALILVPGSPPGEARAGSERTEAEDAVDRIEASRAAPLEQRCREPD